MTKTLGIRGLGKLEPTAAGRTTVAATPAATGPAGTMGSPAPSRPKGRARFDPRSFLRGLYLVETFSITPYGLV